MRTIPVATTKAPRENKMRRPIFFFNGISSRERTAIGMIKITQSEKVLVIDGAA